MDKQTEMLEAIHYLNSRLHDISNSLEKISKTLANTDHGICTWVDDNRSDGKKIAKALEKLENTITNTSFTQPF